MIDFLRPPTHQPERPIEAVDPEYRRLRIQVFVGIFVGYAGYYLVRKNFTGLFGYLGGSLSANILIGYVVDRGGWDAGFALIVAACVLSIVLTAMTVRVEARHAA